tara:strand:+ start:398 stop:667 length:270 start_codon:yes stop_codon:yes gene_type:complete
MYALDIDHENWDKEKAYVSLELGWPQLYMKISGYYLPVKNKDYMFSLVGFENLNDVEHKISIGKLKPFRVSPRRVVDFYGLAKIWYSDY